MNKPTLGHPSQVCKQLNATMILVHAGEIKQFITTELIKTILRHFMP